MNDYYRHTHTHTQPPAVLIVIGLNVAVTAVLLPEESERLQLFGVAVVWSKLGNLTLS